MNPHVLNPDSTVLQQVDGHWQKLAALLVWKFAGRDVVRITADDIKRFGKEFEHEMPILFTHGHSDSLEFSIVTEEQAKRLMEHDQKMRGRA